MRRETQRGDDILERLAALRTECPGCFGNMRAEKDARSVSNEISSKNAAPTSGVGNQQKRL
jgi:hypothetical protein